MVPVGMPSPTPPYFRDISPNFGGMVPSQHDAYPGVAFVKVFWGYFAHECWYRVSSTWNPIVQFERSWQKCP